MITYESVKSALDDIVNKKGLDYRPIGTCQYVDVMDGPLCIVGVYLVKYCNVPTSFFGTALNAMVVKHLKEPLQLRFGLKWEDAAMSLLNDVQESQDGGATWADAVAHAARLHERDEETFSL